MYPRCKSPAETFEICHCIGICGQRISNVKKHQKKQKHTNLDTLLAYIIHWLHRGLWKRSECALEAFPLHMLNMKRNMKYQQSGQYYLTTPPIH